MTEPKSPYRVDYSATLLSHIEMVGITGFVREYMFHPTRRWRFDIASEELMIAIECEGGIWVNGAHVRGKHFESDCLKYNEAAILGWTVLRFTPDMINDGRALQYAEYAVKARKNG